MTIQALRISDRRFAAKATFAALAAAPTFPSFEQAKTALLKPGERYVYEPWWDWGRLDRIYGDSQYDIRGWLLSREVP